MQIKLVVCKNCGNEERMRLFSHEDAQREAKALQQVYCSKCGSTNVRVVD